ncbi:phage tail protein [Duffyella gerundensis]|uniref:phage tail protein n=1 Tax=Duffyella gerundensis TaxID=1619313 RepID=UPI0016544CC3|nr:phage tail protein [Duffyella gerundensis]
MTQKYYAIVTNLGAAKIANAAALGTKLNITQMAVGDGSGTLPTPNASQTKLVNEVRRAAINSLSVDEVNASQIIAEQIIPETEGGFWIREMGLFDADGTLIAVCNTPETYKPALQEGSGRTQTVRMILIVNSTDAITLKIDPSVVLATRKYVDDNMLTVRQYADDLMAEHVAADNPHSQYLQTANALAEIKDAGLLADLLKNLGLGEGSAVPVGVPIPWPTTKPPEGWLKCNGASFSATTYPILAKVYPALKLLDLRGEFIRGWDDGRGTDAGRSIGTAQGDAMRNLTGQVMGSNFYAFRGNSSGVFFNVALDPGTILAPQSGASPGMTSAMDASRQVPTASEFRPRNIALNYIVRAA